VFNLICKIKLFNDKKKTPRFRRGLLLITT
jgi:hypothetical protein